LVARVVNVDQGSLETRELRTGKYVVNDISCQQCHAYLGWKYIRASLPEERYKENMYMMEQHELYTPSIKPKKRSSLIVAMY
jgi:hypothetical protein